ncbi:MAG: hypothetical protein V4690_01645 [Patescibacteria group bacterium]
MENTKSTNYKRFLIFVLILAGLGVLALSFTQKDNELRKEPADQSTNSIPQRVSMGGKYICLPHTNTEGPQTMECAFGIQTDDGSYYGIDFATMSQMGQNLKTGDYITANGVLVPIENLSTDHWRKYPIKGIFSVTDSVKVNEK